jgi:hypothetical protein
MSYFVPNPLTNHPDIVYRILFGGTLVFFGFIVLWLALSVEFMMQKMRIYVFLEELIESLGEWMICKLFLR